METSRERVLKAINHIQSEITPVHIMGFERMGKWFGRYEVDSEFELRKKLGLDLEIARAVFTGANVERELDVWGSEAIWGGYKGSGLGQSRGAHPLAGVTSVADIGRFAWPDPDDFDYETAGKVLRTIPDVAHAVDIQYASLRGELTREDAARTKTPRLAMAHSGWFAILCTLFHLFGLEGTLVKFYSEPKIIEAAIAHVEDFTLGFTRRVLAATKGSLDIFLCGDDFSTQRGMMISPEHWRKFLKPTYKKIAELVKGYDVKVWFHSCGTFRPVLPDLIDDIGIDVWETSQVHLPGNEPEVLKREYGKDICFCGAINSQHTLPFGTTEDVRAEVRERIRVLGKGGGYICGPDHSVLPDVPFENVLAMLDEARKCSP